MAAFLSSSGKGGTHNTEQRQLLEGANTVPIDGPSLKHRVAEQSTELYGALLRRLFQRVASLCGVGLKNWHQLNSLLQRRMQLGHCHTGARWKSEREGSRELTHSRAAAVRQ